MSERVKLAKRTIDALEPMGRAYVVWDAEIPGFGVRISPRGRRSFLFRYRVGGGRRGRDREPVIGVYGALTPDEARKIARAWAAEVAAGGDPAQTRAQVRDAPTMSEVFDRYLAEHAELHKKPASVIEDRRVIATFLRPELGAMKVGEVTRAAVSRLHREKAETPYSANRMLALLSKVFNLAEAWELRPDGSNPCRHVARFKEHRRERFLSEKDAARLGAVLAQVERGELRSADGWTPSPEVVPIIRLLIFTGARRGEVLGLRWEWIDLKAGRARLPDSKTGAKVLFLAPPAVEILSELWRTSDRPEVFPGRTGAPPLTALKRAWPVIRETAELPGVRLHDLRHSFASVGAAAGLSLPMIGALLGHREVATTARYAHLSDDPQRAAAGLIAGRLAAAMAPPAEGVEAVTLKKKREG